MKLKDDILGWIDEYGMDYNQDGFAAGEFEKYVYDQCVEFMKRWRRNIAETTK